MKINRSFVAMLAVLLALVALALWQARPQPIQSVQVTPTQDPREAQTVFRSFNSEMIQALRIDDPESNRDLILERDGDTVWRLVGVEDQNALDVVVADNIAKTIAFMPYLETLPNVDADDYVNFGLTPETFWLQIQVILLTSETRNIVIGNLVPGTQNGYYALVDDRPDIYILNRGAVDFLAIYLRQVQPLILLDRNLKESYL